MRVLYCRHCPFYCPDKEAQRAQIGVYGHCAAQSPAQPLEFVMEKTCPYGHDGDIIEREAKEKGFFSHDLRFIRYYSVDEEGIRSPYYRNYDDMIEQLKASPFLHHALYIAFFDANMRRFGARRISADPGLT